MGRARLLEKAFGPSELIARLGGDEFVVVVADPDGKEATDFERHLRSTVKKFNEGCSRLYRVSISVGATKVPVS